MKTSNRKYLRLALWSLSGCLVLFAFIRLYFNLTDDFRIGNISYEMPFHPEWEIPPLSPQDQQRIEKILAQPFTYIGKGAQSYAFSSADNQYVLKFFKFKHLTPHWFVELFPPFPPFSTYREKQALRKNKKLYGVFEGYRLAYEVHQGPSGLIYIHLNKSQSLHKAVKVKDKLGLQREIELDSVAFLLQEKAKTTRLVIQEALDQDNLTLAKHRMRQIFDLYLAEYKKGIYDKDHGVMHNTGFVGEKPIHLDVGKMTRDNNLFKPTVWQRDMEHIAWKFSWWIAEHYPSYHPVMAADIEAKLTELFNRPFMFSTSTRPPKKH